MKKLKKNNCLVKKYIASMFIPATNDHEKQSFLSFYGEIMDRQTQKFLRIESNRINQNRKYLYFFL